MRMLLADPQLQAELGPLYVPEEFEAALSAAAAAHDVNLPAGAVASLNRPDVLGLSRWEAAPVELDGWPGPGWLPARAVPSGGAPAIDWAWFGDEPLRDPFFEGAVRRATALPMNRLLRTRTTIEALVAGYRAEPEVRLDGLIFHLSRCGSTLIAQMLMAAPSNHVLSEPEPFDAVLQWAALSGVPQDEAVLALRAIVAAMGRQRQQAGGGYVIKLDAWHLLSLPLLRAAFPDTPWLFVFRNPVEILVSLGWMPGAGATHGALTTSLANIPDAESLSLTAYAGEYLARLCESALDHWHLGGGLAVDYRDLPGAVTDQIARHFNLHPGAADLAAMTAAGAMDAKAPDRKFAPDTQSKQQAANAEQRDIAERRLAGLYVRMQELRAQT